MKKISSIIIGSVSAFAGILLIIYISFFVAVINNSFLLETNKDLGIAKRLKISEEDLSVVTTSIVSYVKGQQNTLQVKVKIDNITVDFFNNREMAHIADVRRLIKNIRIFMLGCLAFSLLGFFYLFWQKKIIFLAKGYFISLTVISILVATIGIIAAIDFKKVINGFHYLFFNNDTWIMNPALDRVVWLFTEDMYVKAIIRISTCLSFLLVLVTTIAAFVMRKASQKEKQI